MSELHVSDNLARLIAQYTDRSIDEKGVSELLQMIRDDSRITQLLAANVYADLFLHAKYDQQKWFQSAYIDNESEPYSFESDPLHWINEIDNGEHSPIPIFLPITEQEPDKSLVERFFFWGDSFMTQKKPSPFWRQLARIISAGTTIVAGLFVIVALFLILQQYDIEEPNVSLEHPDRVAVISGELEPVWTKNMPVIKMGQSVVGSALDLAGGMTRLTFDNDTEVLLQGPCKVRVDSPLALWCSSGTVTVHASPSASGFVVNTPYARVVDRGTEFTVNVNKSETCVDVAQGLVEVCRGLDEPVRLNQGKAAMATREQIHPVAFEKDRQLSFSSFHKKMTQWYSKLADEKQTQERQRRLSPWLIAWYSANSRQGNIIPNKVEENKIAGNLTLSSFQEEEGTLPGSRAIAFTSKRGKKGMGQFQLPGTFKSVTLVASVRINELQSQGNMIFASKQFGRELGGIYWQISRTGELYFCVTNEKMENVSCQTKPLLNWKSCGGWYKFAVVADGEKKTVSHYIDGKRVAKIPWNDPVPITIDQGQLGFLSGKSFNQEDRTLGGVLDEFKFFNHALGEAELALE